jgi:hypothetical protein
MKRRFESEYMYSGCELLETRKHTYAAGTSKQALILLSRLNYSFQERLKLLLNNITW